MNSTTRVVLLTLVSSLCAAPVVAQTSARSGFGLSLGLGRGSTGITCEDCGVEIEDRLNGISGYLRVGGYVSPQFFLGVEGTGWIRNSDDLERRIAAASVVFLAYPSRSAGLFLRAGAGAIRAVIEDADFSLVGEGLAWSVGLGFDIGLGAAALTPFVTYLGSREVAADLNGVSLGVDLNPDILQFGLALTVR
jgi:hypothetical protein